MGKSSYEEISFPIPGEEQGQPGTAAQGSPRGGVQNSAQPVDFSRMTKQQLKLYDETIGSYQRLLGNKPITLIWLLNHYSKANMAAYKAQKAARQAGKQPQAQPPAPPQRPPVPPQQPNRAQEYRPQPQYQPQQPGFYQQPPAQKEAVQPPEDTGTVFIDRSRVQFASLECLGFQQTVKINKYPYRIGRVSEKVDLCISDNPAISAAHAEILCEGGAFYIKDLNSLNHVFVNGAEIPRGKLVLLQDNTNVRLGNEEFIFHC